MVDVLFSLFVDVGLTVRWLL